MPNDTITTADLVLLAEYCGKKLLDLSFQGEPNFYVDKPGTVWGDPGFIPKPWQPHLDANQRAEVVEACKANGLTVVLYHWSNADAKCLICSDSYLCNTVGEGSGTPGLAVCRAALKIGGKDAPA